MSLLASDLLDMVKEHRTAGRLQLMAQAARQLEVLLAQDNSPEALRMKGQAQYELGLAALAEAKNLKAIFDRKMAAARRHFASFERSNADIVDQLLSEVDGPACLPPLRPQLTQQRPVLSRDRRPEMPAACDPFFDDLLNRAG